MQKDKQERYLELLAGLRLMDDDFFSEALDEKIAPVEYILNTVLERDDIRVLRTEAQVEYKSAANRSIKLDIRAVDAEGRVMDIEVQRADRGAGVRYLKETEGGRIQMCRAFEEIAFESAKEATHKANVAVAQKMLADGGLTLEQIAKFSSLPLSEVQELADKLPA